MEGEEKKQSTSQYVKINPATHSTLFRFALPSTYPLGLCSHHILFHSPKIHPTRVSIHIVEMKAGDVSFPVFCKRGSGI